jgi:dsDNA-binding SOS-regulon protein
MKKHEEDLQVAYDKMDELREILEFNNLRKEQKLLEEAREALNRFLSDYKK